MSKSECNLPGLIRIFNFILEPTPLPIVGATTVFSGCKLIELVLLLVLLLLFMSIGLRKQYFGIIY